MEKCQFCGKPAMVHVTQIVNNKTKVVRMCNECAAKQGLFDKEGLPFAMLASMGESLLFGIKQPSPVNGLICSKCGCTPMSFKETGKLGCPNCYKDLQILVDGLIESSQKGMQHKGKRPRNHSMTEVEKARLVPNLPDEQVSDKKKRVSRDEKLKNLQNLLNSAIKNENYEEAARIRDEIKLLREKQKKD